MNWWTHFLRDERLAHAAPDMLSMEELVTLQATLLAKMMVVNGALHRRYAEAVTSLEQELSGNDARNSLVKAEKHIEALNRILRDELALVLSDEQSNEIDGADDDHRA
mgnify:CR=1 FL=1